MGKEKATKWFKKENFLLYAVYFLQKFIMTNYI